MSTWLDLDLVDALHQAGHTAARKEGEALSYERLIEYHASVSYTHLDVYKRQVSSA